MMAISPHPWAAVGTPGDASKVQSFTASSRNPCSSSSSSGRELRSSVSSGKFRRESATSFVGPVEGLGGTRRSQKLLHQLIWTDTNGKELESLDGFCDSLQSDCEKLAFSWGYGGEGMGVSGAALDFRAFLLRGHSLRLYRAALRSARRAPAYSREDLERNIREEFELHRFEGNAQTIRFLLSDGLQRLKQLNTMLGIQGHENPVRV